MTGGDPVEDRQPEGRYPVAVPSEEAEGDIGEPVAVAPPAYRTDLDGGGWGHGAAE
jgi:hypothetical protein